MGKRRHPRRQARAAKAARHFDDPIAALAAAERQAAEMPSCAWHLPATRQQRRALAAAMEAHPEAHPPENPTRLEATRWLTWLRFYGEPPVTLL